MNRRKEITARGEFLFELVVSAMQMNGHDYIKGSLKTGPDENDVTWYRAVFERKDDMISKIFGI